MSPEHKPIQHKPMQHKPVKRSAYDKWKIASFVLVVLLIISIFTNGFSISNVKEMPKDKAAQAAVNFINAQLLGGQATAELKTVTEANGMYVVNLSIKSDQGTQEFQSYISKDGVLLMPQAINMVNFGQQQPANQTQQQQQAPTTVPKTDKPTVELFVMSHCPFGTQAEKGILPAVRALGNKIDFKIKFVYYAMHGEKEVKEQMNQYCIQKEQTDKYLSYLACFLNASNGPECIVSSGIDQTKLNSCVAQIDKQYKIMEGFNDKSTWLNGRFPKFNTDADLNTKYGVGGSPTLIINGVESNAGRDSASYLNGICAAFKTPPKECQTQVSSTTPSSGFGYGTAAEATQAGCGV